MNISGIRTYAGFYDYNTIKSQEARNQQIAEAKAESVTNTVQEEKVQREDSTGEMEQAAVQEKPDLGVIEYAKQYQPDVTYEMKGADSETGSLDVEKVLSDLQKDQMLMQYQVFVGENRAGVEFSESREDERFYL